MAEFEKGVALQSTLKTLGPGAVALYTLVAEQRVVAMLVTAGTRKIYPQRIDRKVVRRKIAELRQALENPRRDPLPLLREFYGILVGEELRKDLDQMGVKHILWSLDDTLRYIPVVAL